MNINLNLFDQSKPFHVSKTILHKGARGDTEEDVATQVFTGKSISDINCEVIFNAYSGKVDVMTIPGFLSDEAFVHFLPAIMQAAIDCEAMKESQVSDLSTSVVFSLRKIARRESDSKRLLLENTYNEKQLREVARFLVEMRDNGDPDRELMNELAGYDCSEPWEPAAEALREYWGQYL